MVAVSGADTVTFSLVGFVVVLAIVVVWRLVGHDRRIRTVRFGVFYERELEGDEAERQERLARKDERP